jgi:nitrite reductase/ring-hydroxylating ferredoxin subunit
MAYGQIRSYNDFKKAFKELLWDGTLQSEIRCHVYQGRYDYRSGESFSEHYIVMSKITGLVCWLDSKLKLYFTTLVPV